MLPCVPARARCRLARPSNPFYTVTIFICTSLPQSVLLMENEPSPHTFPVFLSQLSRKVSKNKPKEVSVPSETQLYVRPGKEEVKLLESTPILEAAMPQASTSAESDWRTKFLRPHSMLNSLCRSDNLGSNTYSKCLNVNM